MANRTALILLAVAVILCLDVASSNPSIGGYDFLSICIQNCAQCKKMYGPWFEGQKCADTCLKFKGKLIPDCEDPDSIAPFINKI